MKGEFSVKKVISQEMYESPILYNARNRLIEELKAESLLSLSKELGVSINTLQKIVRLQPISYDTVSRLIIWCDKKSKKTPLSVLLSQTRLDID